MDKNTLLHENYTYEELANALYLKGEAEGFHKVTDKTKWREPVMAEKLGHIAHSKISAGLGTPEYGSDAWKQDGTAAEYKTKAVEDDKLRNLLQLPKPRGGNYVALTVDGVYNVAYKDSAIEAYSHIDHYFGVFYKERCVLIIQPNTDEVIRQLFRNHRNRKPGATTNLNSVKIKLSDTHLYETVHRDESFFSQNS